MVFPSFINPFSRVASAASNKRSEETKGYVIGIPIPSEPSCSTPADSLQPNSHKPASASRARSQSVATLHNPYSSHLPFRRVERSLAEENICHPTAQTPHSSTILDQDEPSPLVARKKHPRPPPLSLRPRKLGQGMASSGSSESPRSRAASSGGVLFEMIGTPISPVSKSSRPNVNLSVQALPSPGQVDRKLEAKKLKPARRRGVPFEATRPSVLRRASSLDSAPPSITPASPPPHPQGSTEGSVSSRKSSNASSALSYSERNESPANFSPGPSTAYTTPLSSANRAQFHNRGRQFSLGNPVLACSPSTQSVPYHQSNSYSPISPKTTIDSKSFPSPPDSSTNFTASSALGITRPSWKVSFPTAFPSRDEEILPDCNGLVLEISSSVGSCSRTAIEPVLQKRTGKDSDGKEWVKWEIRLCLPPRRFGSSPNASSPIRTRKTSRTTALKAPGISQLSKAVTGTPKDAGLASAASVNQVVGPGPGASPILPASSSVTYKPTLGSRRGTSASSHPSLASLASSLSPNPASAFTITPLPKVNENTTVENEMQGKPSFHFHSESHRSAVSPPLPPARLRMPDDHELREDNQTRTVVARVPGPVSVSITQVSPSSSPPSFHMLGTRSLESGDEMRRDLDSAPCEQQVGFQTSVQSTPLQPSPSVLVARGLAHAKLLGASGCPLSTEPQFKLGYLSVQTSRRPSEVSYWSETDASQTEAEDDEDGDDQEEGGHPELVVPDL